MVEVISSSIQVARKDYEDSAGVWIYNCLGDIRITPIYEDDKNSKLTFSDWRAIARLKANNWKIKKGQLYERSRCKQNGEIYTFRCIPEINKICRKLNLYSDC